MAKKRTDFTEIQNFIKKNPNLTETQSYFQFREKGGKLRKQTFLEQYREFTGKEKGEFRKATTKQVKEKVSYKKREAKNNSVMYKPDYEIPYNQGSENMLKQIKNLYGYHGDNSDLLKVKFSIATDEFTTGYNRYRKPVDFGFIMKNEDIINFQSFIRKTLIQAEKYYKRLQKRYNNKSDEVNRTVERIEKIRDDLKGKNKRTVGEVKEILEDSGFHFKGIEHILIEEE